MKRHTIGLAATFGVCLLAGCVPIANAPDAVFGDEESEVVQFCNYKSTLAYSDSEVEQLIRQASAAQGTGMSYDQAEHNGFTNCTFEYTVPEDVQSCQVCLFGVLGYVYHRY